MKQIAIQISASLLLVFVVVYAMWRLPKPKETSLAWAPSLALLSAWCGLLGALGTGYLWIATQPDVWLPPLLLILLPGAVAAGTLVLWLYRGFTGDQEQQETADVQCLQARVGIFLGLAGVALGYLFVLMHKAPMTPVGQ